VTERSSEALAVRGGLSDWLVLNLIISAKKDSSNVMLVLARSKQDQMRNL